MTDPWVNPARDDEVQKAEIDAVRETKDADIEASRERKRAAKEDFAASQAAERANRRAEGNRNAGDLIIDGFDAAREKAGDAKKAMQKAASAEGLARGAVAAAKGAGRIGAAGAGALVGMAKSPASSVNLFFWIAVLLTYAYLGIGLINNTLVLYFFLGVIGWLMVFRGGAPFLSRESLEGLAKSVAIAATAYFWPVILSMLPFLNDRVARIIAVAFPVYILYFVFIDPQTSMLQRMQKLYIIILIILMLGYGTVAITTGSPIIPGLPNVTYDVRAGLLDFWDVIWQAIQVILDMIQRFYDTGKLILLNRIDYATGGQLYTGQTDPNADTRLGVFFEKMEKSQTDYYDDEPVGLWGVVKASTLDDSIRMNIRCIANYDNDPDPEEKNLNIYADSIIPSYVSIDTQESHDIDCNFNKGTLTAGSHTLSLFVDFTFTTTAKQKSYFVDEERAKALKRSGIDILDQYGITDKEPTAVYTNGPMMIGMNVRQQPVMLSSGMNNPVVLGVSLQNRWEGKIMGLRSLQIKIPASMNIQEAKCNDYTFSVTTEGDEAVYTLNDPDQIKEFEPYKTFRCPLEFNDVQTILGSTPVATRYFNVEAEYIYQLERKETLRVMNSTLYKRP